AAAIALLLPSTFAVTPVPAIIMLAEIYYGAMYGGSTTSILVQHPGRGGLGGHLPSHGVTVETGHRPPGCVPDRGRDGHRRYLVRRRRISFWPLVAREAP